MFGATIFALFFTLFGTILGGISADQSWGRFWGWDPKENGALLIVMWQIMMIHLRITGYVKPTGFALGMIMNNIVVVLALFGVNLLSIGLHSYGFASGIARNLTIFISIELLIGFTLFFWATFKSNNEIINVNKQIISPRENKPIITIVQDTLLGINKLTRDIKFKYVIYENRKCYI